MARIEVDIGRVIEDIGPATVIGFIRETYDWAFMQLVGDMAPAEIADTLKKIMSPEALAELREALK